MIEYEENLDKNFDKALKLCLNTHSHEELIEYLKNGNLPEKQYAALEINCLKTQSDADIFISNLTGCDGKIREAVAQKITEFIQIPEYVAFLSEYPETFAKATIDINANISRMIVDSTYIFKDNKDFALKYTNELIKFIYEAFDGLDKIIYKDKKYTLNKQLFKLYWCLDGISNFSDYIENKKLYEILERCIKIEEYTVREKAAYIIYQKKDDKLFQNLYIKIDNDINYYVRKAIKKD